VPIGADPLDGLREEPNVTNASPPEEPAMSPEEAFRQYLDSLHMRARRAEAEKLSALYETLAADADVMRLLCFIQLGYSEQILAEVPAPARLEAHARGWLYRSGRKLTIDGTEALLDWLRQVAPHKDLPPFQLLWKAATGW
jgi:hypothetical protein